VSTPQPTDEELMTAFYAGNDAGFNEIDHRWRRPLFWYFRRRIWRAEQAADLVQETLMRVYRTNGRQSARYDPSQPFRRWLYSIAGNVAAELARRERRQPGPLGQTDIPDDNTVPVAEQDEHRRAIAECLGELPEREAEFLRLWEGGLGDLSQTDIAQLWGVSNPTVTRVQQRALAHLRAGLERRGYP
jgi:RNA polymerase sigma-70 factor (ECF subfamily)